MARHAAFIDTGRKIWYDKRNETGKKESMKLWKES